MVRIERHELGPRVYLLRRRIHEWHAGIAIALLLAGAVATDRLESAKTIVFVVLAATWLVAKDWRDLAPSTRDTTAWRIGVHKRPAPLRALRRADFLPPVAAVAAMTAGVADLVSTATPNIGSRERLLAGIVSTEEMRLLHAVALPAAAALMLTSVYLFKRRRGALHSAIVLLVALAVVNVAKGLDLEEAAWSLAAAALLWWGRDAFHVRHDPASLRSAAWRVPALLAGTATVVVGSVAIAAPGGTSAGVVFRTAGDLALWRHAPLAFHDELGHFPLAISLVVVSALLTSAYLVFRPLAGPGALPAPNVRTLASELVRAHGNDTLAYFKLRRDKHYVFSADAKAFLGYRIENGVMVVSGDPVGAAESVDAVLTEAVAFAERRGLKIAAVGAGSSTLGAWKRAGCRALYIGDEAIVETQRFSLDGRPIRKVRQSVSRLEKAGYTLVARAADELDDELIAELERVSAAWRRGTPERGFSMAMDSLRDAGGGSLVVVARDRDGSARAFLQFVPTYGRRAMSLSFMRRDPQTPNGLMEFLVARSIEILRRRGVDEVSLNFAAFARVLHSPRNIVERAAGRLIAVANPFFQIESLYRFNAKFFPRWEPRYLVYEGVAALPRAALAVLWAEGQLPRPRLPWRARA